MVGELSMLVAVVISWPFALDIWVCCWERALELSRLWRVSRPALLKTLLELEDPTPPFLRSSRSWRARSICSLRLAAYSAASELPLFVSLPVEFMSLVAVSIDSYVVVLFAFTGQRRSSCFSDLYNL